MRIDKVILKAVLSTLLAIIVLCGVMVTALVFLYPSTLMEISYNVGMDSASAWFADCAYNQSDNIYYIGYATEVAIGAKNPDPEAIEKYGEKFIVDEQFPKYCAEMDELSAEAGITGSYAQYIYGQVYTAKYRLGKKTEAVEAAFAVNRDSFPRNNAVAAVLFAALDDGSGGDIDTMKLLLEGMQELKTQAADFPDEDLDYLNALIKLTAERMDELS